MAEHKIDTVLEDYGTKPVPDDKARSWFEVGIVIWGVSTCIPAFMLGAVVGSSARLGPGIVAVLVGSVILTVISLATGLIGSNSRLSIAMNTKLAFGKNINILIGILLFIGSFGWFAFQLEIFGQAVSGAISIISNQNVMIPKWVFIIIGGVLMNLTAMYGFRAIEKLTLFVIPLLMILLVATIVTAYSGVSLSEAAAKPPANPMPFGILISIVAGGYAVGATVQPDITRYSKDKKNTIGAMIFGMMGGFPLVLILAVFLGAAAGEYDFSQVMLKYHAGIWGIFAMIVIIFATWTTNDNNLYSSALALNALVPKMKKWQLTIIGASIGTILALVGILGQFVNWMVMLGVTIPPIASVMAVEFFLFRDKKVFDTAKLEKGEFKDNIPALISWAIATAFGLLTFFQVFTFTTAPTLDAIIVAVVLHTIILLATGRKITVKA